METLSHAQVYADAAKQPLQRAEQVPMADHPQIALFTKSKPDSLTLHLSFHRD
jgi:hypothetical protein